MQKIIISLLDRTRSFSRLVNFKTIAIFFVQFHRNVQIRPVSINCPSFDISGERDAVQPMYTTCVCIWFEPDSKYHRAIENAAVLHDGDWTVSNRSPTENYRGLSGNAFETSSGKGSDLDGTWTSKRQISRTFTSTTFWARIVVRP